jgi:SAM-dependent methyltransferase
MTIDTTSPSFFDEKYQADSDPWHFAISEYEQARYAAILKALDGRRYGRAFEPGCSIGVLTARLASFCDTVIAIDISTTAVKLARERCQSLSNVAIFSEPMSRRLPLGQFELIVFSEIGYYFPETELQAIAGYLAARLSPGGVLLAAHWLGESEDHLLSGDQVHQVLSVTEGLTHEHAERHDNFRLDRWSRI